ncbi:MAG: hypothetical protein HUJ51_03065 [Eggerthellaceae bacterium]|nr:hypothetical protein [Eggerthellaceae bacterium]
MINFEFNGASTFVYDSTIHHPKLKIMNLVQGDTVKFEDNCYVLDEQGKPEKVDPVHAGLYTISVDSIGNYVSPQETGAYSWSFTIASKPVKVVEPTTTSFVYNVEHQAPELDVDSDDICSGDE